MLAKFTINITPKSASMHLHISEKLIRKILQIVTIKSKQIPFTKKPIVCHSHTGVISEIQLFRVII